VVRWLVAGGENAGIAQQLIEETCLKYGIARAAHAALRPRQPHARQGYRGTARGSRRRRLLLAAARLERQPALGGPVQDTEVPARVPRALRGGRLCARVPAHFFGWYNDKHRHSGIGFKTPVAMHFGPAPLIWQRRAIVLESAYPAHPARFKRRVPLPPSLPGVVGINLPRNPTPESPDALSPTPECPLHSNPRCLNLMDMLRLSYGGL